MSRSLIGGGGGGGADDDDLEVDALMTVAAAAATTEPRVRHVIVTGQDVFREFKTLIPYSNVLPPE